MPSFTPRRTYFAAGRHLLHARFSWTHCEIGTGTFWQGERNSETYCPHSFFSRGVSALVSTPSRTTSGVGFSFVASSAVDLPHVEPDEPATLKIPMIPTASAFI